jgi:hypothetical protein
MFLLRLVAAVGIVVTGFALARLCRATGWRAGWPWMTFWSVRDADAGRAVHNESVMLAFWSAGGGSGDGRSLRARSSSAPCWSACAAVKSSRWSSADPAPGLAPVRRGLRRRRREPHCGCWIVTGATSVAAGIATLVLSGPVFGFDLGWISQVGDGTVGCAGSRCRSRPGTSAPRGAHHVADQRATATRSCTRSGWVSWPWASPCDTDRPLPASSAHPDVDDSLARGEQPGASPWYLLWPLVFLAASRPRPRTRRGGG